MYCSSHLMCVPTLPCLTTCRISTCLTTGTGFISMKLLLFSCVNAHKQFDYSNTSCLNCQVLLVFLTLFLFNFLNFYRVTRMHSADYVLARCLSVCPSVCPLHAGIVSKWLYISLKFFHRRVAPPF